MPVKALKLFNGLVTMGACLSGLIFLFMMVVVCVDVVLRYLFNNPLAWTEEVCEYLLLYVTFLGAAWLLRNDGHVRVDLINNYLGNRTKTRLKLYTSLAGMAACSFLFIFGCNATWELIVRGTPEIRTLNIPKWWVFWIIPYGGLMLTIEFFLQAHRYWSGEGEE